jgi:Ca2+-binding EF-hand superfamily protein
MCRIPLFFAFVFVWAVSASSPTSAQDAPKKVSPKVLELIKGSADDFIKEFDKGKKGYLTKEDVPPLIAANFAKFDTNGDGKLDKKEVEQMLVALRKRLADQGGAPATVTGKSMADFDALDKKADGRITREMVKGTPYETVFDEIDTNKDGKLDRKEFAAWLKKQVDKEKK